MHPPNWIVGSGSCCGNSGRNRIAGIDLAEMDYRTWRKAAAQVLRDRYELSWGVMHEGAWIRLYVMGMEPDEAAHIVA
jgi:hypothetical protein